MMGRVRHLTFLTVVLGALLLAPPAQAAITSITLAGTTATVTLDGGNDAFSVGSSGGLLLHGANSTCGTCNSDFDWSPTAGDQTLSASDPTVSIVINGGAGRDTLTATQGTESPTATLNGEDGDDVLTGSQNADALRGGVGNDFLIGFRGADDMEGGDGDDTLVWNNGDGSDVMDGEADRDQIQVFGSSTAGDTFTVQPNGARVRLDRTSPGPFFLDIGTSEAMLLSTLAGDDSLTIGDVGTFAIDADGDGGNDTFNGGPSLELFRGGGGDDALTPGGGSDIVLGEDGNDTVNVRDGAPDFVSCGPETDSVTADVAALDTGMAGCETIARTEPQASTQPLTIVGGKVKVDKKRKAPVAVNCPANSPANCHGTLALATAKKVNVDGVKAKLQLGEGSFDLAPGAGGTVTIKLPKRVERLAKNDKLAVDATALTGASPNAATSSQRLKLNLSALDKRG